MQTSRSAILLSLFGTLVVAQKGMGQNGGLYDEQVLRTLELTFHQNDWWKQLEQNRVAKVYIKADLRVGNTVLKDVGVRFRGQAAPSTASGENHPDGPLRTIPAHG